MICPHYLEHRTGLGGLEMTGSNGVSSNWMGQIQSEEGVFAAIGGAGTGLASCGAESEMSIYNTRSRTILLPANDFRDNETWPYDTKSSR
jgi:hypothetical protein